MAIKRSYNDACAAAHALDLIGERWALLVVRELLLGPKRFSDLRRGLSGISPNVLAQRLNELEAAAVVQRLRLPPPASVWAYQLTPWGQQLEPIVLQLAHWGVQSASFPRPSGLGADAMILSLRTMFVPENAENFSASLEIRLEDDVFFARVAESRIELGRGMPDSPDARIQASTDGLLGLAYGKIDLDEALQEGVITLTGDKAIVRSFLALFSLPEGAFGSTSAATTARCH